MVQLTETASQSDESLITPPPPPQPPQMACIHAKSNNCGYWQTKQTSKLLQVYREKKRRKEVQLAGLVLLHWTGTQLTTSVKWIFPMLPCWGLDATLDISLRQEINFVIFSWAPSRQVTSPYKLIVIHHPVGAEIILKSYKAFMEGKVGANSVLQGPPAKGEEDKSTKCCENKWHGYQKQLKSNTHTRLYLFPPSSHSGRLSVFSA